MGVLVSQALHAISSHTLTGLLAAANAGVAAATAAAAFAATSTAATTALQHAWHHEL